jgi:hypothetical protein
MALLSCPRNVSHGSDRNTFPLLFPSTNCFDVSIALFYIIQCQTGTDRFFRPSVEIGKYFYTTSFLSLVILEVSLSFLIPHPLAVRFPIVPTPLACERVRVWGDIKGLRLHINGHLIFVQYLVIPSSFCKKTDENQLY